MKYPVRIGRIVSFFIDSQKPFFIVFVKKEVDFFIPAWI